MTPDQAQDTAPSKIQSNSFSRLSFYQNCPFAAKLKYLSKIPEPPRPPPALKRGQTVGEHANERGSRVHEAADDFINARRDDLILELDKYKDEMNNVRFLVKANPDLIQTEQLWTSTKDWEPTDPKHDLTPWLRVIVDLLIFTDNDKTHARVIDFKTGKRYGNEVKHAQQTQLYQLAAFMRYPSLQSVTTELWYLDQKHGPAKNDFTRAQGERFRTSWDRRMNEMCNDTEFKARPHEKSCMFCCYGLEEHSNKWVNKSGDCKLSLDKRDR